MVARRKTKQVEGQLAFDLDPLWGISQEQAHEQIRADRATLLEDTSPEPVPGTREPTGVLHEPGRTSNGERTVPRNTDRRRRPRRRNLPREGRATVLSKKISRRNRAERPTHAPSDREPRRRGTRKPEQRMEGRSQETREISRRTQRGTPQRTPSRLRPQSSPSPEQQFTPDTLNKLAPSGTQARFHANVAALEVLRTLQEEQRQPTIEEQHTLGRWGGWGASGLAQIFDENRREYEPERAELHELFTDAEYQAARRTTINAHYTDPRVVAQMWSALEELGFTGGRVLEPGSGLGNFIGTAPENTEMTGVELDPTTAAISQYLYPQADIRNESFATTNAPEGFFDAVIGNVPFGDVVLHDKKHNAAGHSIHNHFILKSLALTRPGGMVAVLTSSFTLDAQSTKAREQMYAQADLVSAVRLPTGSMKRIAGTEALIDLMILRKREPSQTPGDDRWVRASHIEIEGTSVALNEYFQQNPDHVLGTLSLEHGMYNRQTLTVTADLDQYPEHLNHVLSGDVHTAHLNGQGFTTGETRSAWVPALTTEWAGTIRYDNKEFSIVEDGQFIPLTVPKAQQAELIELLALRDQARTILEIEAATIKDSPELEHARHELHRSWQNYTQQYGPINRYTLARTGRVDHNGQETLRRVTPGAIRILRKDPHGPLVAALEEFNPQTQEAKPAQLLLQRQIIRRDAPTHAQNPQDALSISLNSRGYVDPEHIGELLGVDAHTAIERLGDAVYELPPTQENPGDTQWETRAAYLSGNVRQKLRQAQAAALEDPRFNRNITALEAVQPTPLAPHDIRAQLGSAWVPDTDVTVFIRELLEDPQASATNPAGSNWVVQANKHTVHATQTWGTKKMPAGEIIEALLEQRKIQVNNRVETLEGKTISVLNPEATAAAQDQAERINEAFESWIWRDPERANRLVEAYNNRFNNLVLRDYSFDGERMTFPGLAKTYTMRPHQKTAIARMISEPSVGLFHEVGAGKTLEMIVGATELKRLGMINKPLLVVPNHMLEQFSAEWLQAYPAAKILAASTDDLRGKNRQAFMARAAANNWDAVIMTQEAFKTIPVSNQTKHAYYEREEQLVRDQLEQAHARLTEAGLSTTSVKAQEKQLLRETEKRQKYLDSTKKDTGLTFEQMGVDYLLVDEMHLYKNLRTVSAKEGLGMNGSDKATDLHMKVDWLRQQHGNRVITGATATPISNSIAEMYVIQRYLAPELLHESGITTFDQWAATFGQTTTSMEVDATGRYKMKERFASFQNVPELLTQFHQFGDIKLSDDLNLPVPEIAARADGERAPEIIGIEPSPELKDYIKNLQERAESIQAREVEPTEDNMLKLSTDGRKAALDMRLVTNGLIEPEWGKIHKTAQVVTEVYEDTKNNRYLADDGTEHPTPGALQIIFCDFGTPNKQGAWNAYDALRDQLAENGIPREKIRFIQEARNNREKQEIFNAARTGEIAVLIGSTTTMGVGTNVQTRAIHLVDMDAPWRPSDVHQRHGRIIRQGNQNTEIKISQIVTRESFDTFMWQTLERKARFIDQIMRGNPESREIEDIGSDALNYAEVKAITSGNPLILEKAKIDQELAKLERLNRSYAQGQNASKASAKSHQSQAQHLEQQIPIAKTVEQQRTTTTGEKFNAQIANINYTDRKEAANALAQTLKRHLNTPNYRTTERETRIPIHIGNIPITSAVRPAHPGISHGENLVSFRIENVPNAYAEARIADIQAAKSGPIQRLENMVAKIPQYIESMKRQAKEHHQEALRAQELLTQEFKHTHRLQELRHQAQKLEKQLTQPLQTNNEPTPALSPELEQLQRLMQPYQQGKTPTTPTQTPTQNTPNPHQPHIKPEYTNNPDLGK